MPLLKHTDGIVIVGSGTLATALAVALFGAGFRISEVVSRDNQGSLKHARKLAARVKSRAATLAKATYSGKLVWICVPDDAIATVAARIAKLLDGNGKIAIHSSGALESKVLSPLAATGAAIAAAHPLMTFVNVAMPQLDRVPFALEGDPRALALVAGMIRSIGGKPFHLKPESKSAYHLFGFFSSPAIVALLSAAESAAGLAGLPSVRARKLMAPIVHQTIHNCLTSNPREAFSGPLRRGDIATIRKHFLVLQRDPQLRALYRALVNIAMDRLPVKDADIMKEIMLDEAP